MVCKTSGSIRVLTNKIAQLLYTYICTVILLHWKGCYKPTVIMPVQFLPKYYDALIALHNVVYCTRLQRIKNEPASVDGIQTISNHLWLSIVFDLRIVPVKTCAHRISTPSRPGPIINHTRCMYNNQSINTVFPCPFRH